MKYCFLILGLLASPFLNLAEAVEVEGVSVANAAKVGDREIALNGAGVRTKFFFDIYVGALYLSQRATSSQQAVSGKNPKRITMYFLYDEVSSKKLIKGWVEGFEKNQPAEKLAALQARLDQFNALFVTAHKGDQFIFDFLKDGSTVVTLKGRQAGVISGVDFQQALLNVWLGEEPADDDLKEAMLGG